MNELINGLINGLIKELKGFQGLMD